ncbi:hypothetical protein [Paenibacillus hamazuiensis]|uniref:hypothetical protein n=1 Tax=Paenibacillus hamazuiensis TaxID=2936508 RepID=UPI00200DC96B|nr:hypothetical protein [Paenibacillus hamazuiensis]
MHTKVSKTLATLVISASLLNTGASAAWADEPSAPSAAAAPATVQEAAWYHLTEVLDVQLKSVLNEPLLNGTRIGVVVKMKNNGSKLTRVPEYDLRVTTSTGIVYTLKPSAANAKAIEPMADSELSYMAVIDRTDAITLTQVNWTDVDYYVYPKKETPIVDIPITQAAWRGSDTGITDPKALLKWSDVFTIPSEPSPIQYTPVDIHKESTEKGTVYLVQLLAYNPNDQREIVPEFTLDGKSESKVFAGSRVEQGTVALEAKEQKYIHFAIPTDQDTVLSSLNVLTTEKFSSDPSQTTPVTYQVGRLNILLPNEAEATTAEAYQMGTPMKFDANSELIHPQLQVSLVEFHMSEDDVQGNQTAIAKFVLHNQSERPLAVPLFQTGLVGTGGYDYPGKRQEKAPSQVLPNSSIVVSYAFSLPASETGQNLKLKIEDAVTAAPYKSTVAAYAVQLQPEPEDTSDSFSVYPFDVKVENWDLSYLFNTSNQTYTYKGKFFLDIQRTQQTELDATFPNLQFELYDNAGRLVATGVKPLIGQGRLVSGENNLPFNGTSEQFDSPLTLKIFEVFPTANGDAKRLVAKFVK